jgi:hypothetical protein
MDWETSFDEYLEYLCEAVSIAIATRVGWLLSGVDAANSA